jgi:hypothetical protein
MHACQACTGDTFEPNDVQTSATAWSVTQGAGAQTWNGSLCTSRDVDYGRVTVNFYTSTFTSASVQFTVTSADSRAVTTVEIFDESAPSGSQMSTHYITGTGTISVLDVRSGRCLRVCDPRSVRLHITTTWPQPIAYQIVAQAN